jgi:hypothetical protein
MEIFADHRRLEKKWGPRGLPQRHTFSLVFSPKSFRRISIQAITTPQLTPCKKIRVTGFIVCALQPRAGPL